jgi:AraC family L-rhamnose operon transcriptional activator RhaR
MHKRIEVFEGLSHYTLDFPIYINRWEEGFELAQHRHDFVEIAYIASGKGFHYVEEKVVPVFKGDIFLLPVGSSHVFRPASLQSKERLTVYNCIFSPLLLDKLDTAFVSSLSLSILLQPSDMTETAQFYWFRDLDGRILEIFETMYEEFKTHAPGYDSLLHAYLVELLVRLYRIHIDSHYMIQLNAGETTPLNIEESLHYIKLQCNEPLTLDGMAELCMLSKRHFYRLFREHTGQTFTEYIQNKRIERSCRLLVTTQDKILAISEQVGYTDVKFFTQLFKKKMGVTPNKYRTKLKA